MHLVFKNNVDPDQMASEMPSDQNQHCYHFDCKYLLVTRIMHVNLIKFEVCGVH